MEVPWSNFHPHDTHPRPNPQTIPSHTGAGGGTGTGAAGGGVGGAGAGVGGGSTGAGGARPAMGEELQPCGMRWFIPWDDVARLIAGKIICKWWIFQQPTFDYRREHGFLGAISWGSEPWNMGDSPTNLMTIPNTLGVQTPYGLYDHQPTGVLNTAEVVSGMSEACELWV